MRLKDTIVEEEEGSEDMRNEFVMLSIPGTQEEDDLSNEESHQTAEDCSLQNISSLRISHDSLSSSGNHSDQRMYEPVSDGSRRKRRELLRQNMLKQDRQGLFLPQTATNTDASAGHSMRMGSKTGIELDLQETRLPMQLATAKEQEVDLLAATNVHQREDYFQQILPGRFRILRQLGRGYNGIIYAATETIEIDTSYGEKAARKYDVKSGTVMERQVAVKFLEQRRAGHVDRRLREISALAFLPPHPNIVRLLSRELQSVGGYEFFVMELCDTSLDVWIRDHATSKHDQVLISDSPPLGHMEAIRLMHELCDAVLTMQQFGVAHRDIKPSNILLSRRENNSGGNFQFSAKLADFGVADMQVGKPARLYDNYIGIILEDENSYGEENDGTYSTSDDFRASVASVLFAWLGEACWENRSVRERLFSDHGFEQAVLQFRLGQGDAAVRDMLERALPAPRIRKRREVLSYDKMIDHLERMGDEYGLSPKLKVVTLSSKQDLAVFEDSDLNMRKLEILAQYALSAISGRRYAKDFAAARKYLDWVQFVFSRYPAHGKGVPDRLMMDFHYQLALSESYPKLQSLVQQYSAATRNGRISAKEKDLIALEIESTLKATEERIIQGQGCLARVVRAREEREAIATERDHPEHTGFSNMHALVALERVKYLVAGGHFDRAAKLAEEESTKLQLVLEKYQDFLSNDGIKVYGIDEDEDQGRVSFRCCRNAYLLLHEAIKIAELQQQPEMRAQLASEAVDLCSMGLDFIQNSPTSRKEDCLEMGRCLAESLYIAGRYQNARNHCRLLFDKFFRVRALQRNVLRLCSVWVASLRELLLTEPKTEQNEVSFELGFVSCFLTLTHREQATALVNDTHALANAQVFLATDIHESIAAGASPLFPVPLLPQNDLVSAQSKAALEELRKEQSRKA